MLSSLRIARSLDAVSYRAVGVDDHEDGEYRNEVKALPGEIWSHIHSFQRSERRQFVSREHHNTFCENKMQDRKQPFRLDSTVYMNNALVAHARCLPWLLEQFRLENSILNGVNTMSWSMVNMSVKRMESFCSLLSTNALAKLDALMLDHASISDDGITVFSNAIATKPPALASLTRLRLDHNQIGMEGMIEFSKALSTPGVLSNLRELNLSSNKIEAVGMIEFSKALSTPGVLSKLRELNLSFNKIEAVGVSNLSLALSNGALASLKSLNLLKNDIAADGMRALAGAIKPLSTLNEVNVLLNPGENAFAGEVAGSFRINADEKSGWYRTMSL